MLHSYQQTVAKDSKAQNPYRAGRCIHLLGVDLILDALLDDVGYKVVLNGFGFNWSPGNKAALE